MAFFSVIVMMFFAAVVCSSDNVVGSAAEVLLDLAFIALATNGCRLVWNFILNCLGALRSPAQVNASTAQSESFVPDVFETDVSQNAVADEPAIAPAADPVAVDEPVLPPTLPTVVLVDPPVVEQVVRRRQCPSRLRRREKREAERQAAALPVSAHLVPASVPEQAEAAQVDTCVESSIPDQAQGAGNAESPAPGEAMAAQGPKKKKHSGRGAHRASPSAQEGRAAAASD